MLLPKRARKAARRSRSRRGRKRGIHPSRVRKGRPKSRPLLKKLKKLRPGFVPGSLYPRKKTRMRQALGMEPLHTDDEE